MFDHAGLTVVIGAMLVAGWLVGGRLTTHVGRRMFGLPDRFIAETWPAFAILWPLLLLGYGFTAAARVSERAVRRALGVPDDPTE